MQRSVAWFGVSMWVVLGVGCGPTKTDVCTGPDCNPGTDPCATTGGVCPGPLVINELMADNDGVWIDNVREADDWIELYNKSDKPIELLGFAVGDRVNRFHLLPSGTLGAGEVLLLWADAEPNQGPGHLPFKLSSGGETIYIWDAAGKVIDKFTYPPLAKNDSFARVPDGTGVATPCAFATPSAKNGAACTPPEPPSLPQNVTFAPYAWPEVWPTPASPMLLAELDLHDGGFVEVQNTSDQSIDLGTVAVTIAAQRPGEPWPVETAGATLAWPQTELAAGARVALPVAAADIAELSASPDFEGVVTLWQKGGAAIDRVDFMAWPAGAVLAHYPDGSGPLQFCTVRTRGAENNDCAPLLARAIASGRLRHIYTPGDFDALAAGGTTLGMAAVKFVVDMQAGDVTHLLGEAWDLHYTFVRELIDHEPHLDRCDPNDRVLFNQGWMAFSRDQYVNVETRRYLLGTLVHHVGNGAHTVEFTFGDQISPEQMKRAFFNTAAHTLTPKVWSVRAQDDSQIERLRTIEGTLPAIGPNAPFQNVVFQPLSDGLAYGVLTFIPVGELSKATLNRRVVVVTDQVPNAITLVGGLITEAFQTPLAHVNILSKNRGTPNMALRDARNDPRLAGFFGKLVRFEVTADSFDVRLADAAEAEAFWQSLQNGDPLIPRLDTSVRGITRLVNQKLDNLPSIGAKAAGLAELGRINSTASGCPGTLPLPRFAMAVPMVHSIEHYEASGAKAKLAAAEALPEFKTDPVFRDAKLEEVRSTIKAFPVDATLLADVTAYVELYFKTARVRFRSSSNVEDLPGFNGAGLYTSASAEINDPDLPVADAIRTVWASLYNTRAYDERRVFGVDETTVAMAVLVHEAAQSEEANGVAITRDLLDPIRGDIYFINSQAGEASVTNPAPGVTTEQLQYQWNRSPRIVYKAQSSMPNAVPVLTPAEVEKLACSLRVIHQHFKPLLDPLDQNRWFAMDVEFKLRHGDRALLIKQARQYNFGNADAPDDCREF